VTASAGNGGGSFVSIRADFSRQSLLLGTIPIGIALALPIWQLQFRYGWLEMALGAWAWLFWTAVFAWAVCVILAIKRFKWWWLLLTTPVVLFPVVMAGGLLAACATGDCL
jgi:hypothetical protein